MLVLVFTLILSFLALGICILILDVLLTGKTPLITTPKESLLKIIPLLKMDETSVFYDLGCGTSHLLFKLSKAFPHTAFVGIDNSFILVLLSRIIRIFYRSKNVRIRYANFFNVDLSDATHLYLWIIVKDMDKLLIKLQKELKPGTYLYALDFPFTKKTPVSVTDLGKNRMFGHTLYTYIF